MKASDYIAAFLSAQGVTRVYEMTGGMITHLLDSIHRAGDIRLVSMHHEQAAAFAAEGEARMSGVPAVAMATSGPGATNLVTGIGSCFFDSVPAVFVTGQVNTTEQRADSGVRQSGFQETDIVAIVEPITKAAWRVRDAAELPELLERAFVLALEGRKGPVLLDIPMDVQRAEIDPPAPVRVSAPACTPARGDDVERVRALIEAADRPLVLAGGGVRAAGAADVVRGIAEAWGVPVVTSLLGVDVLPASHPQRVGLIGTYGNRWANEAMGRADLLLVLGSRLDNRQTGADVEGFGRDKTIVRVDVDAAELAWRVTETIRVHCDVRCFAEALTDGWAPGRAWDDWRAQIDAMQTQAPDDAELADVPGINVASLMHALSRAAVETGAFVADVGQNQMWAAQSLRLEEGQRFLTSAGMGAMGFALPTAIGAALATGRTVVAIAGDGGMQVNIQELETVVRLGLPVKTVVLDNGCLGMVRQFQDEYFESRYQSTMWGYGAPDFVAVAEAYGMPASRVDAPGQVDEALRWLRETDGPALLHVKLDPGSRVRPKVAFGNPVFVMEPPPGQRACGD